MSKNYAIRYLIEPWNEPRLAGSRLIRKGLRVSDDNHGYADAIFLASIIKDDSGEVESVLLLSSESVNGKIGKEMLLLVRDHIDHCLEHHV